MKILHQTGTLAAVLIVTGFVAVHAKNHVPPAPPAADLPSGPLLASTPQQLAVESKNRAVTHDSMEANQVRPTSTDEADDCD